MELHGKVLLGKVIKPHGLQGLLKVSLSENIKELLQPEALFVLENNRLMPYFITSWEETAEAEVLLGFEDIDSPEKGRLLSNSELWVDEKKVVFLEENELHQLIGYRLQNAASVEIGVVNDVLEFPSQLMLEVKLSADQIANRQKLQKEKELEKEQKLQIRGNESHANESQGNEPKVSEPKEIELPLVPLVEDWILEIDHDAKVIRMDLPEGLLELEL